MTTLVCNLKNGAVTHYDWPAFQSLTPTQAGGATGLFDLDTGSTDLAASISWSFTLPRVHQGTTLKKLGRVAYIAASSSGGMGFAVRTPQTTYWYPVADTISGVCRAQVGRGIRENYEGFAVRGTRADVVIDRVEVELAASKNRRTH